jgi:hypothetical protein
MDCFHESSRSFHPDFSSTPRLVCRRGLLTLGTLARVKTVRVFFRALFSRSQELVDMAVEGLRSIVEYERLRYGNIAPNCRSLHIRVEFQVDYCSIYSSFLHFVRVSLSVYASR